MSRPLNLIDHRIDEYADPSCLPRTGEPLQDDTDRNDPPAVESRRLTSSGSRDISRAKAHARLLHCVTAIPGESRPSGRSPRTGNRTRSNRDQCAALGTDSVIDGFHSSARVNPRFGASAVGPAPRRHLPVGSARSGVSDGRHSGSARRSRLRPFEPALWH